MSNNESQVFEQFRVRRRTLGNCESHEKHLSNLKVRQRAFEHGESQVFGLFWVTWRAFGQLWVTRISIWTIVSHKYLDNFESPEEHSGNCEPHEKILSNFESHTILRMMSHMNMRNFESHREALYSETKLSFLRVS